MPTFPDYCFVNWAYGVRFFLAFFDMLRSWDKLEDRLSRNVSPNAHPDLDAKGLILTIQSSRTQIAPDGTISMQTRGPAKMVADVYFNVEDTYDRQESLQRLLRMFISALK